jgi:uncharacterized membrane protein
MDTINIEWRRQFATRRETRIVVLLGVGVVALSFAVFLWWFAGVWVILPFAGLEFACVAFAFWWLEQSANDRDSVEVSEACVKVIRCRRHNLRHFVFKRGWISTELRLDRVGQPRGVQLRQSGRSIELLEFLPVSEQQRALRELRSALDRH